MQGKKSKVKIVANDNEQLSELLRAAPARRAGGRSPESNSRANPPTRLTSFK